MWNILTYGMKYGLIHGMVVMIGFYHQNPFHLRPNIKRNNVPPETMGFVGDGTTFIYIWYDEWKCGIVWGWFKK